MKAIAIFKHQDLMYVIIQKLNNFVNVLLIFFSHVGIVAEKRMKHAVKNNEG